MQTADWHTANIRINVIHQNTKCRHHRHRTEWNATNTHHTVFMQYNKINKVKNVNMTEDMEDPGIKCRAGAANTAVYETTNTKQNLGNPSTNEEATNAATIKEV